MVDGRTQSEFDPYAQLGIGRDASAEQIKAAHRRAVMDDHPDRPHGDRQRFEATQRAARLLLDQRRRQQYDRTGNADEPPSNQDEAALSLVLAFIDRKITDYVATMDPAKDPRWSDLFAEFRDEMNRDMSHLTAVILQNQKIVTFLSDMRTRFSCDGGPSAIARAFDLKIEAGRRAIDSAHDAISQRSAAMAFADRHRFRFDHRADLATQILVGWAAETIKSGWSD